MPARSENRPIDTAAWPGLTLREQIVEGNRNEVWRGELGGASVAVRRSRRPAESLRWELDLIEFAAGIGLIVPTVIPTRAGAASADGIIVQRWLDGVPPQTAADRRLVATELARLHAATHGYPQRPGCCTVVELGVQRTSVDADLDRMPSEVVDQVLAVFAEFVAAETAVVHGDPADSNIRIMPGGGVGLLDWDESRVDVTFHDLSNLGVRVLNERDHVAAERLSNAWEATNGWQLEPDYARRRLADLT